MRGERRPQLPAPASGTVARVRRVLLPVLAAVSVLLPSVPASAHDEDGDYLLGEDPGDIAVLADCTLMQRNFAAPYLLDYRLETDLVESASRIEVVSDEAWVAGFTIASPNWRAHRELPDSVAHADRLAPGDPEAGLLLRLGFERKDGAVDATATPFAIRVLTDGVVEPVVVDLLALRAEGFTDPGSVELFRQWCHEPVPAVEPLAGATGGVTPVVPAAGTASGTASGGFPVLPAVLGGLGILGLASVLLLLRRRR